MISGVGSGASSIALAAAQSTQQLQTPASPVGETASAFDIALQIQDVQHNNLKRTLDAQTTILDLLA